MARPARRSAIALTALLALPACASAGDRAPVPTGWRTIAKEPDRARIRTWRDAWTKALAKARASGNADRIDALGPLLRPDAALNDPVPPRGDYRCRVFKIGAQAQGGADFNMVAPAACRVAGDAGAVALTKIEGAQRPGGRLYPDGPNRMIFLGAMRMADEGRSLDYGADAVRDMAGVLERIGPRRWRLVLPWPRWDSLIEVVELTPAE
ncbi:MAG: hypothetical protein JWM38_2475 [Sphingomonas bacterium]|nr:hypothetical protein [Sphingomonas bacterium]MDB5683846.1 hypothetical protein [Sphingomonas bacterium]MDB5719048.1 hypothetical protein [Sphingomonas bacterium]